MSLVSHKAQFNPYLTTRWMGLYEPTTNGTGTVADSGQVPSPMCGVVSLVCVGVRGVRLGAVVVVVVWWYAGLVLGLLMHSIILYS